MIQGWGVSLRAPVILILARRPATAGGRWQRQPGLKPCILARCPVRDSRWQRQPGLEAVHLNLACCPAPCAGQPLAEAAGP
jgi:hypothetical protein